MGESMTSDCVILLDRPKTPDNAGMVFRSALAFGAKTVILCGPRWNQAGAKRLRTDPSSAFRHLDVCLSLNLAQGLALVDGLEVVVVERGGRNPIFLDDFIHP